MATEPGLSRDGFMTISDAAQHLGISRSKVYQEMHAGRLRYAKFGRSRRIPRRALVEYAERAIVATE